MKNEERQYIKKNNKELIYYYFKDKNGKIIEKYFDENTNKNQKLFQKKTKLYEESLISLFLYFFFLFILFILFFCIGLFSFPFVI